MSSCIVEVKEEVGVHVGTNDIPESSLLREVPLFDDLDPRQFSSPPVWRSIDHSGMYVYIVHDVIFVQDMCIIDLNLILRYAQATLVHFI